MKPIKRSIESLQKIALEFKFRSEFAKKNSSAYQAAKKMKILDEVCAHMEAPKTKALSYKEIQEQAFKYTNRRDFQKNSPGAYHAARKRGIIDQISNHMRASITEAYTFEEIHKKALECKTRTEFKKKYSAAYNATKRLRILDQVFSHMVPHLNEPYSIEEIREEALKYSTRGVFAKRSGSVYGAATKKGILDQVCAHMKRGGDGSIPETEILDLVKSIYPKAQKLRDNKVKIEGKSYIKRLDIDIYIPELRKGIEFDGKFHHSFKGLKRGHPTWPDEDIRNYHEIKDSWFQSKGIELLHIDGKEWEKDKQYCIDKCMKFLC